MSTKIKKALTFLTLVIGLAGPIAGQSLTPQQIEMLRNNPELVRREIQRSGMTESQIRQRLSAAGYDPAILDSFLGEAPGAATEFTPATMGALTALELDESLAQGLVPVPQSIGFTFPGAFPPAESTEPDSSAMELPLFGLEVFRRPGALFQPTLSGPVPADYRVGPGDAMVLVLTGDVEDLHQLSVTREGFMVIPQIGQLQVNNLTMAQLRLLLRDRLGAAFSGVRSGSTQFDITITRLRTIQVFVTGEVLQPSAYQLSSVATVMNGLYAAGGPTENANFRNVQVRRAGTIAATFDLYEYLLSGRTADDIGLRHSDVVFVPVHGTRATIRGAVVRPAEYELAPGESLRELVQAAGGFRADASLRRVSITRIVPVGQRRSQGPDRVVIDVPLDPNAGPVVPSFPIEPGDEVIVTTLTESSRSFVDLDGAVYEPGRYGWRPGLRLSELIQRAGGFQPAVYAGRAHVSRLNPADSTRYLVSVELPADSNDAWPNDIVLDDYDVVTVYGRVEFREARIVEIGGMVNSPGVYEFRDGMTLKDLVLQARGLRDGAYLDTAEVARLPTDRSEGTMARRLRVPMDSTYLVDQNGSTYRTLPGPGRAPAAGTPDFALEPFDQVSVFLQPDFTLIRRVRVTGEVRFPGPYALTSKAETVSDLVARAGGLLPTAFADGARFFRSLDSAGPVNLELASALDGPHGHLDIILQPGDSLHIPEYRPTVRVEGAVASPTSVLFREGAYFDYYVENAGGYTREADKGRVSVQFANGSRRTRSRRFLLFGGGVPAPGPGSVITVPLKDPDDRLDTRGLIADIVAIIGSITTIIVVATR